MLDRLQTRSRLYNIGVIDSDTWVICGQISETLNHLFDSYEYRKYCIRGVMNWLGVFHYPEHIDKMTIWVRRGFKGSKWRRRVITAAVAASAYLIWQARNNGFLASLSKYRKDCQNSKFLIKTRVVHIIGSKVSGIDKEWTVSL